MLLTNKSQTLSSSQLTRASVDGLVQAIESGHKEVFSSYLQTMAKFHTYSARNVLLIAAQRPNATHLEGIRSWNELGRAVLPGEKGIFIFAPAVGYTTQRSTTAEAPAKQPKRKKTAQKSEPKVKREPQLLGFRGVYVFDIAQTAGSQLQQPASQGDISVQMKNLLSFVESQQVTIEYSERIAPNKGTSYYGKIRLLPDMAPEEAFCVLVHEVASQLLYSIPRRTVVTRALHQQETKAIAFVVCEALGLKGKKAFADCQLYYGDARLLTESLEVVHTTAARILGAVIAETVPQKSLQEVR